MLDPKPNLNMTSPRRNLSAATPVTSPLHQQGQYNSLSKKTAIALSGLMLSAAVGVASCSADRQTPQGETTPRETTEESTLNVVASHSILCDLTQEIARDTIELTCAMGPDQDPHTYTTTPSDRKAFEAAQLILYGGYELEPAIDGLVEATKTAAPKVAVYEVAVPDPILAEHHHHGEEDHAGEKEEAHHHGEEGHAGEKEEAHHHEEEGHAEGKESENLEPDPHVWLDVKNGMAIAEVIQGELTKLNPEQADFYRENTEKLQEKLERLDGWVKTQIATIPEEQRILVTTHDGFNYYTRAYGFKASEALQGVSTEEEPTAARVKELVGNIQQTQVPTIFAEIATNDRVIQAVAREANVKISEQKLLAGGLGEKGSDAETYIGAIATNTCIIVNELGGNCTDFE